MAQTSEYRFTDFYGSINRVGPRLLRSTDRGLADYLEMESEATEAFWGGFWGECAEDAFEMWWSEDPQRAVTDAFGYWLENVEEHLNSMLEPDGILAQYAFELRHDDPEGERKQTQAHVKRLRIKLDKMKVKLFIDATLLESNSGNLPALLLQGVIMPLGTTDDGTLIEAVAEPWWKVVELLKADWNLAYTIPPLKWEEIIAAAFESAGYDVTLTPRSGDHGRDVIAVKNGVASIKIIDSIKAYKKGHLVTHEEVRALAGVLLGDQNTSKGILTTTSDFAPGIKNDPFLRSLMPYRLELMNGTALRQWLVDLALARAASLGID